MRTMTPGLVRFSRLGRPSVELPTVPGPAEPSGNEQSQFLPADPFSPSSSVSGRTNPSDPVAGVLSVEDPSGAIRELPLPVRVGSPPGTVLADSFIQEESIPSIATPVVSPGVDLPSMTPSTAPAPDPGGVAESMPQLDPVLVATQRGSTFSFGSLPTVASALAAAGGQLAAHSRLSNRDECLLVPGSFSCTVQQVLGATALAVVTLKYALRKKEERPLKVFCFDFAKIAVGALLSQLMAFRFSNIVAQVHLRWLHESADACDWFFVSQVVDSSLGIWVVVKMLRATEKRFSYASGKYNSRPDGPPLFKAFLVQLFIFIWITLVGKLLMFVGLGVLTTPLSAAASSLLPFVHRGSAEGKFFMIMIVVPVLTNLFQYCTMDSIIKFRKCPASKEERAFLELYLKMGESSHAIHGDDL